MNHGDQRRVGHCDSQNESSIVQTMTRNTDAIIGTMAGTGSVAIERAVIPAAKGSE